MESEYESFVNLYKSQSLIEYSKIEFSPEQLLDRSHKYVLTFMRQNFIEDLHEKIIQDIFEQNLDFSANKINVANSATVKGRKYFIIPLPADPDLCNSVLFTSLFNSKSVIDVKQTLYVENNLDLPILEMLSFIYSEEDIKVVICQNVSKTPDPDEIPIILEQYHCGKKNIHRGINETIRRIRAKYNWTGLTKDVEKFIRSCDICQKVKICRKNLKTPLVITETPKTPFERINIDILEIPTRNYALIIRDELTKHSQAYNLSDKTAKSVVNALLIYFQHFGTPLRIHCDSGREFDNSLLRDLCLLYDIKLTFSSVGHPQSNGSVERFNATLLEMIRAHMTKNPKEHPLTILPYAIICYNNTKNKTTGFTPYELVFGHTSGRPPETLYNEKSLVTKYIRDLRNKLDYYYKVARSKTVQEKEKSKLRFDRNISESKYHFKVGDLVWLKESQISGKLRNKFNGPFEILEIYDTSAKLLNTDTNQETKVNFDRLKPYFDA